MFGYVNPLRGEPLTGEPDAGEPPVRFGGRGNETNRLFLPLCTLNETHAESDRDLSVPSGRFARGTVRHARQALKLTPLVQRLYQ